MVLILGTRCTNCITENIFIFTRAWSLALVVRNVLNWPLFWSGSTLLKSKLSRTDSFLYFALLRPLIMRPAWRGSGPDDCTTIVSVVHLILRVFFQLSRPVCRTLLWYFLFPRIVIQGVRNVLFFLAMVMLVNGVTVWARTKIGVHLLGVRQVKGRRCVRVKLWVLQCHQWVCNP
jgi:hypothetical protein